MEYTKYNTDILRINIATTSPVNLLDFTNAFRALASEFNAFVTGKGSDRYKLYIKEVRKGSIEIDLTTLMCSVQAIQQLMPIVAEFNAVAEFCNYFGNLWNILLVRKDYEKAKAIPEKTLRNMHDFIEPIAKDCNATATMSRITINGDVNAPIIIASPGACCVQKECRRLCAELKTPNAIRVEQTLLMWYQSRNSMEPLGDKAIISSIGPKPVKTIFVEKQLKEMMLKGEGNPFSVLWLVDVLVEYIDGVPKLYKIESMERIE